MAQGQAESDIYVTRGPIASHCQPTSHHPTIPSTKRIFISHSSCPTCLTIQHMVSGFLVFWFLAILVIRKTTGLLAIRSWQPPAFQSIKVSPFPWHNPFRHHSGHQIHRKLSSGRMLCNKSVPTGRRHLNGSP